MRSIVPILLLTLVLAVSGCRPNPPAEERGARSTGEASEVSETLPVALPDQVKLWLKPQGQVNGQLAGLSERQVELNFGGEVQRFPLMDVERLQGLGDLYIDRVEGTRSPIRGEDRRDNMITLEGVSPGILAWSDGLTLRWQEALDPGDVLDLMDERERYDFLLTEIEVLSEDAVTIHLSKQSR